MDWTGLNRAELDWTELNYHHNHHQHQKHHQYKHHIILEAYDGGGNRFVRNVGNLNGVTSPQSVTFIVTANRKSKVMSDTLVRKVVYKYSLNVEAISKFQAPER